jgi:CRISPR-associated exonuclease Cas4
MAYNEEDYLQLSGIQHFLFCRRQWALIHVEQQWAENFRTTDGTMMPSPIPDEERFSPSGE